MTELPKGSKIEAPKRPEPVYLDKDFFDGLPKDQGSEAVWAALGTNLEAAVGKKVIDPIKASEISNFLWSAADNAMKEMQPDAALHEPEYWEANRKNFEVYAEDMGLSGDLSALIEHLPNPNADIDIPEAFRDTVEEKMENL